MFRPADLRRESTNVYCDLERAVLQITINSRERIRRLLFRRPASRWHFGIAQKSILAVKSLERRPLHHFKLNTSRQPRLKRTEFPAPFFPLLTPLLSGQETGCNLPSLFHVPCDLTATDFQFQNPKGFSAHCRKSLPPAGRVWLIPSGRKIK